MCKRNRGKGLRDALFWKMFQDVMWKEGDGDRIGCGELGRR